MVATLTKTAIWAFRFVQWIFAVIILAVSSYFVHQFHHFFSSAPRETVVPLVFSVLAIIFTSAALIGLFFLNYAVQLISAVLDFILWIGFLTSAGLLRHNYHILGRHNLLLQKLYFGRISVLEPPHWFRNSSLVRLLAASVIIEVILFFITMLLQLFVAKKYRDERRLHGTPESSRFSRSAAVSEVPNDPYNPGGVNRV